METSRTQQTTSQARGEAPSPASQPERAVDRLAVVGKAGDRSDGGALGTREIFGVLAGRWTRLVMEALQDGSLHYNRLLEQVEGVSSRMLTHTLRAMERQGIIVRYDLPRERRRQYELTDVGQMLLGSVRELEVSLRQCENGSAERGRAV